MKPKARFLGHPVHPMLVHIPLGLFFMVVVFDAIYLANHDVNLAIAAFWDMVAAIVAALFAAFFGLLDFLTIPKATRAYRIGLTHGIGNAIVTTFFAISAVLRWDDGLHRARAGHFILECAGLALAAATAWLGGELMERLGVGIDSGAHLNAQSSLRRPSSPSIRPRTT